MNKVKLGVFGLGRGKDYFEDIINNDGEIVAVCERNEKKLADALEFLGGNAVGYNDFDSFINHPMDAVFIANCFNEHTSFAIKCLEKGINVLCECTSNSTMGEGVALVRAAEKSKGIYMLAENYPFMLFNREMKRVFSGGTLGKLLYAEGEYNHPFNYDNVDDHIMLRPYHKHWRNHLPRSYYITHSLAPLMYITGAFPKRVAAFGVFSPFDEVNHIGSAVGDRAAVIMTLNDDNSVFRVTGCAAFGAHGNSYRICGQNGQIENLRGDFDRVMLRYNSWQIPDGMKEINSYIPDWAEDEKEFTEKAGHGGSDFFVIKEFFDCIKSGRKPVFDEYFATAMASVAILAHKSLLEKGIPYDIPDFRNEDDRKNWENDFSTPFWVGDKAPDIPCCSHPDYRPDEEKFRNYLRATGEIK